MKKTYFWQVKNLTRYISVFFFIWLTLFPSVVGAIGGCDTESDCCETTIPSEVPSEDDCCVSFCFCSCCGTAVFFDAKDKVELQEELPQFFTPSFFYHSPIHFSFSTDVFHPPQVA
ncbi:MAG: hypothetical protein AAF573_13820 [Bacteroidota bacterium]